MNPAQLEQSAVAEWHRRQMLEMADDTSAESDDATLRRGCREGALSNIEFQDRGLRLVYQTAGNAAMKWDCYALATGRGDMIGAYSAKEVAGRYGVTKQAVTKLVTKFQDCLGIPPMPGQRGERGRKEMSKQRKAQLQ